MCTTDMKKYLYYRFVKIVMNAIAVMGRYASEDVFSFVFLHSNFNISADREFQ